MKNPTKPIYVICSESHYTVLFSLGMIPLHAKRFDFYYYDGLANQASEIRLSIDLGSTTEKTKYKTGDLVPPLELCIRTKWPNAVVDWNGTEPLL
jgi:ubiquitin carboxyl-terminal hydrolase MINDY-3/4